MPEFESFTGALYIVPKGDMIYSEMATKVGLEDEAAGLFITVEQHRGDGKDQKITFDVEEWVVVREAVDRLAEICKARNSLEAT